jgi:tetratricopeptide (TPR) repeat protein
MKRVSAILLATAAVAFGIGGGSSGVQNAPQQSAPQAAPPQQTSPLVAPLQQAIQVFAPQPQPVPATAPAQGAGGQSQSAAQPGGSNFLGKDIPFFDPGSNIATWDGKNWNVSNNVLFQARFEKYLNAPAATTESDNEYQALLGEIMDLLAPGRVTSKSLDQAFQDLAKASRFQQDAHLCDSIASQVYSAWLSRKSNDRLHAASKSIEDERKRLEWNARLTAEGTKLESSGGGSGKSSSGKSSSGKSKEGGGGQNQGGEGQNPQQQAQQLSRDMQMQPIVTRLAEVNALIRANQLKREVAELQVKIEFQSLIIQHFLQRRFQHVIIGTRFYRNIFADGDSRLRIGEDAKSLFAKTSGLPPNMGTIDSIANEIMRDVHEGIQAFNFLLEKNELESATKRLAETFILGEYLPEVRTLNREDKRKALAFVHKSNQLISAIEVKDYALAEKLVAEFGQTAKDFDAAKPMAVIETAKQISTMHIAKARNAAVSGDKATLEAELKAATEIWPRNPSLTEVSKVIFSQADVQSRAMVDFDQLVSQKNYRQIYEDRMRFIAATAMYPEKQEQLRKVLEDMQVIEIALVQAQEIEKRGDYAGAWESAEKAFRNFPDDNKLNQVRTNLTTKAADFVHAIRQAEELEQKKQPGSSLAWYLKAQSVYPPSDFARQGVDRLTKEILPDAS